jgi:hypothetical protein
MTLKANEVPRTGKSQEPLDIGSYPSRLVMVLDLGLQPQTYNGETKDPKIEIMTTYELADEFMKDDEGNDIPDKPRWLSETFTLNSLNSDKAKSTQRYLALDPALKYDGDWSKLLGTPATITVVNNPGKGKNKGKVFNNIASVSSMRAKDAEKLPPLVNDKRYFDQDEPDVELFLTLPQFIQDKMKSGLEFKGSKLDQLLKNHTGKPAEQKVHKDADEYISKDEEHQDSDSDGDGGTNW